MATYTNLAPGNYLFRLSASNNKGVPAKADLLLPITITPPLWQTWWFRTGAALLTAALVLALYRWRVRRLTLHARRLEAVVAERTSALEASNRKLAKLSATDALTGIANRRCFDETLAREWRRGARAGELLALAMIDIDHFKAYNDHYGHPAGDACLRQVAQALAGRFQRAGDVLARYGGEEFVLIAPGLGASDALDMGRCMCEVLTALALPHVKSSHGHVSASIGIAVMAPGEGGSAEQLKQAADQALYPAKAQGRNCCVLAPVSAPAEAGV